MTRIAILLLVATACDPTRMEQESELAAACIVACGTSGSRYAQEHDPWTGSLVSSTCTCLNEAKAP